MDQNQAQAAANLFPIIFQALTAIAALLAAAAAFHAAGKSSKTAVYQSYFDKKAESYDEYWKAFTAFVFHPNIPDTRRTKNFHLFQNSVRRYQKKRQICRLSLKLQLSRCVRQMVFECQCEMVIHLVFCRCRVCYRQGQ